MVKVENGRIVSENNNERDLSGDIEGGYRMSSSSSSSGTNSFLQFFKKGVHMCGIQVPFVVLVIPFIITIALGGFKPAVVFALICLVIIICSMPPPTGYSSAGVGVTRSGGAWSTGGSSSSSTAGSSNRGLSQSSRVRTLGDLPKPPQRSS